ncbi:hypothetical protein BJX61DRAFT_494588 [Aspergillus egyptiacus]|nr:hypothetical protein BJX61DRAFT_494588 [Aspergillus egyptiacus]
MTPKPPRSNTTLVRLLNYAVFTFLSLILLCLILLTPADAIYQCYVTQRLTNIFIITGGYVVTFIFAALIYATRIYTNRSVLGGIPKAWIPIEKEDVGKSVRRMVMEGLGRSALIAFGARPRDLSEELQLGLGETGTGTGITGGDDEDGRRAEGEERRGLLRGFDFDIDPEHPPWGVIEHPGWSAPSSSGHGTLPPGLCYRTVIRELPHLIEAKAVSLAPPDPLSFRLSHTHPRTHAHTGVNGCDGPEAEEEEEEEAIPDTRIVEILRRPATMSLRRYLQHLTDLDVLNPPETALEFLSLYERARFSGRDLYEAEFRELMGVFAQLLKEMRFSAERLDLDFSEFGDGGDGTFDFGEHENGHEHERGRGRGRGPKRATASRSIIGFGSTFGSGTLSDSVIGPSDEEGETETETLGSETRTGSSIRSPRYAYAPDYDGARSPGRGRRGPRRAQLQAQWPRTPSSTRSASLRQVRSNNGSEFTSASGSGSGGSVIRLADARTESVSGLPYVLGR